MPFAGNFHPEWGYLAPAPSLMRSVRTVLVAAAVGATAGAGTVFALMDHAPVDQKRPGVAVAGFANALAALPEERSATAQPSESPAAAAAYSELNAAPKTPPSLAQPADGPAATTAAEAKPAQQISAPTARQARPAPAAETVGVAAAAAVTPAPANPAPEVANKPKPKAANRKPTRRDLARHRWSDREYYPEARWHGRGGRTADFNRSYYQYR
jgi:hypothetical protein